jgi:hypothetical protein
MEKEFVPYELALRMNQIGFDNVPCLAIWYNVPELDDYEFFDFSNHFSYQHYETQYYANKGFKDAVLAPTCSQAFRWFREKYNIFPEILTDCTTEPKFCYTYTRFFGNQNDLSSEGWGWENNIGQYSLLYRTYEEAELDCLEKLIEIVEQKQN